MKSKTKYEEITKARKILELPESATMQQVKAHYKKLMTKTEIKISKILCGKLMKKFGYKFD